MSKKIMHGMWIGLVLLLLGVVVMAANASQGHCQSCCRPRHHRHCRRAVRLQLLHPRST